MKELTVAEAYDSNDRVHRKLRNIVEPLTDAQCAYRDVSQDKWSVAEIVEHVSIVEASIAGLCARLLSRDGEDGAAANGSIFLSDEFLARGEMGMTEKWQAPERVRPTGARSVTESLAIMEETRRRLEELRPLFETVSCDAKFPHPFLGELTAAEWLCLIGGHAARHLRQIRRILDLKGAELEV